MQNLQNLCLRNMLHRIYCKLRRAYFGAMIPGPKNVSGWYLQSQWTVRYSQINTSRGPPAHSSSKFGTCILNSDLNNAQVVGTSLQEI